MLSISGHFLKFILDVTILPLVSCGGSSTKTEMHLFGGEGRAPARVDITPKYREKHSVTLVKNEDFLAMAFVLASLRLVC